MTTIPNIFLSYRRDDSADITGRIYDRLVQRFGSTAIFRDIDAIPLGVDFRTHIDNMVGECDILLAVIGQDWLEIADSKGNRRLDDPGDFVRVEIQSALERSIPVVPLLVRGASMPRENELPVPLKMLAYRNGTPIRRDPDFHHDLDRLIAGLEKILPSTGLEPDPSAASPTATRAGADPDRPGSGSAGGIGTAQMAAQEGRDAGGQKPAARQQPAIEQQHAPGDTNQDEKLSYGMAIRWHLLFGAGLFYVNRELTRKWLYVFAAILFLFGALLAQPLDLDANTVGDIMDDSTASFLAVVGFLIYLVGLADSLWLVRRSIKAETNQ